MSETSKDAVEIALVLYTAELDSSKAAAKAELDEEDPETQEEGERRIRTSSLIAFPANAIAKEGEVGSS